MKRFRPFEYVKRQAQSVRSSFDRTDIPPFVIILGLSLIAYGASQRWRGVAPIVVGAIVLLYVRPFLRWIK